MIRKEKRSPGELIEVVRHVSELFLFLLLCVTLVTHISALHSALFKSRLSDLRSGLSQLHWATAEMTQDVCPVHSPSVEGSQRQPQQITSTGLIMMPNCERVI